MIKFKSKKPSKKKAAPVKRAVKKTVKKAKTAVPSKKSILVSADQAKNLIHKLIVLDIAVENLFTHGSNPRMVANLANDKMNLRMALQQMNENNSDWKKLFTQTVNEHNKRAEEIQNQKKVDMKFDKRVY
ncbi:hypothetical protein ACFLQI_00230 [Candidatus Undinarchaeota archaeon]